MWARSPKSALSRRTLHYPRVDLDKHWNECGHDRPSWHYLGLPFTVQKWIWTKICKVDILQSGIGPILGNVGLIGSGFGPKLSKWARSTVDLYQHLTKCTLSGAKIEQSWHYRSQIWSKIEQSGHYRDPNRTKWAMWSKGGFGHTIQGWKWTIPRYCRQNQGVKWATRTLSPNEPIARNDPGHPIETFI